MKMYKYSLKVNIYHLGLRWLSITAHLLFHIVRTTTEFPTTHILSGRNKRRLLAKADWISQKSRQANSQKWKKSRQAFA